MKSEISETERDMCVESSYCPVKIINYMYRNLKLYHAVIFFEFLYVVFIVKQFDQALDDFFAFEKMKTFIFTSSM